MSATRHEDRPVNPAPFTQLWCRPRAGAPPGYHRLTPEVADFRFEEQPPIRRFPAYRGKRAHEANYWFTRTQRHVRCESRFEFIALMLLDFSAEVVAVASNPFWILWPHGAGPQRHAPDFFARLDRREALVVDVHPRALIDATVAERHQLTSGVCAQLGWQYHVFSHIDPVVERNLVLLNGFGHPRFAPPPAVHDRIVETVSPPESAMPTTVDAVVDHGSGSDDCTAQRVLAGVYHLLWQRQLHTDLRTPLSWTSQVWR